MASQIYILSHMIHNIPPIGMMQQQWESIWLWHLALRLKRQSCSTTWQTFLAYAEVWLMLLML